MRVQRFRNLCAVPTVELTTLHNVRNYVSNPERLATDATRKESRTLASEGTAAAAFRDAKAGIADAMAEVGQKGSEAMQNVREVRDTFAEALLHSIKSHPYATLAVVGGIGFVAGAVWRR